MTMLPKPFIHQVLASLTNVADLCNALLVCTEWRDVGRSGALWRFMFLKLHGAPTATERGLSGPQLLQQRQHILGTSNHPSHVISSNCFQLCYDTSQRTIVAVAQGPYAVSYDAHPVWFIPAPSNPLFHRRGRFMAPTGQGEVVIIDAEGLHVWDGQVREQCMSLPMNWHVPKTVVASGRFAVTASEAEVCVWCLKEQRCIVRHPYPDALSATNGALQLAVSEELDLVAFGGQLQDPQVHLLQASTGRPLNRLPSKCTGGLCFHNNLLAVLSIHDQSRGIVKAALTLWDTATWGSTLVVATTAHVDTHHTLDASHTTHLQVRAGLAIFAAGIREAGSLHPKAAILGLPLPPPSAPVNAQGWQWVGVSGEEGEGILHSQEDPALLARWPRWGSQEARPAMVAVGEEQMSALRVIHKLPDQAAAVGEGVHISSLSTSPDSIVFTTSGGTMRCIDLP